ncbi:C-type lectin domain family 4 member A-like isoform 1-T3 [Dama dama]|uniref:C-type lectin domain family 4 member A-like n=1 Tax=Dama dama TaxID=30532 RepID=UPI001CC2B90B|nr:C-type lectin domain family 4 member A-like isoform X1 [Cervus elaphus]XP_043738182.1 C-type lectin domain family 4 member A-like isoform X1 [Cervus elaphus]XP_043738183.1 C-type lectin domain family 4 member A-like isoform X1 [Cervus elaphus]XP_043738184.1 C-type lectin domain family 4 member A-like isoform X1 [Cervus elaphus]XP_060980849.1 C-type lectin domain family 4 member A-like [Dama dama]XP_060980850.1 C-type lectin domain family 4 member A-like [Dama dama]XP_060980852.1 C-type lec
MTSEITYAEVKFNKPKSSGTKSEPPAAPKENNLHQSGHSFSKLLLTSLLILLLLLAISFFIAFIFFFQKCSYVHKEEKATRELTHTQLECVKENSTLEGKDWSCCPKNWEPYSSNCYFISNGFNIWNDSEKKCLRMNAHLLVINTKAEQDFITQKLRINFAYYVGLSDWTSAMGKRHWQWVDQTLYNESATFWHQGEPNNPNEHCVMLNAVSRKWGWNDSPCNEVHKFICKMMKIYL